MDLNLTGKAALVTGGTKGIGRGIALTLARAGANVAVAYRQDGEAADALATELKELGGDHHVIQADVTQPESIQAMRAAIMRKRFSTSSSSSRSCLSAVSA